MPGLAILFVLAQTSTAVTVTTTTTPFDDVRAQLEQALIVAVGAIVAAGVAWLKAWLKARLAAKLTSVAVEGVERSATTLTGAISAHLGPEGLAALAAAGIDVNALRDRLAQSVKDSIKSVSIAAGTEDAMAAVVKKVTDEPALAADVKRTTSTRIVAVDGNGDPVVK